MDKITEYKIVSGISPAELTKEVNQLIKDGWYPTGGVFISQSPISQPAGNYVKVQTFTLQAMVKILAD